MSKETAQRIATWMHQLADRESFPVEEREQWQAKFADPEFIEQVLVHVAQNYESRDEGMCKLLDIVDSHLSKDLA